MSFDPIMYAKLGLSTLCYALSFWLVCRGLYTLAGAWKLLKRR